MKNKLIEKSSTALKRAVETFGQLTKRGTVRKGGFKGGKQEVADLKWEFGQYNPQALKKKDIKEVRKEYTRLRDISQKRLKRLGKTEFKESKVYKNYKEGFKKQSELKNVQELYAELNRLARFVSAEKSTIQRQERQKKDFINTMNERYPNIVNEKNYWDFVEYMDEMRSMGLLEEYDSERIIEFFEEVQGKTSKNERLSGESLKQAFEDWNRSREEFKKRGRYKNEIPIPKKSILKGK